MNKILLVVMMSTSLSLLTACGGGGSDEFDPGMQIGTPVAGVDPLVPFSSSGTNINDVDGGVRTLSITMESGFDGDVEATTVLGSFQGNSSFTQETLLDEGIPSINVNDIQRTQAVDFTCDNGDDIRGTISTDFSSGEKVTSGIVNGETINCSSQYESILPTTIFNNENSVEGLLIDYTDADDPSSVLISTDCSDGDLINADDIVDNSCSGSMLRNFVITDDNGGIHQLVHKVTFEFSE